MLLQQLARLPLFSWVATMDYRLSTDNGVTKMYSLTNYYDHDEMQFRAQSMFQKKIAQGYL